MVTGRKTTDEAAWQAAAQQEAAKKAAQEAAAAATPFSLTPTGERDWVAEAAAIKAAAEAAARVAAERTFWERTAEAVGAAEATGRTGEATAGILTPMVLPPGTSTEGMIQVQPQYAKSYPEAVAQIGENYYRPSEPTTQETAFLPAEEQAKRSAAILTDIKSGEGIWSGGEWSTTATLQKALEALGEFRVGNDQYDIVEPFLSGRITEGQLKLVFGKDVIKETRQWLDDVQRQTPELYTVLINEGYDAYGKAVERQNKEFESYLKTNFPDIWQVYQKNQDEGIAAYDARITEIQNILEAVDVDKYHPLVDVDKYHPLVPNYSIAKDVYDVYMQAEGAPPVRSKDFDIGAIVQDTMYQRIKVDGKVVTLDQLKLVFGSEAVDNAKKIILATSPTIGPLEPQLTISSYTGISSALAKKEEFTKLVAPAAATESEIKAIAPYMLTGETGADFDVNGALKADVPVATVAAFCGITDKEGLADLEWQAKYEKANWVEKQEMALGRALQKDPWGTIKAIGISMIPIVGTEQLYKQKKEEGGGLSAGEIAEIVGYGFLDFLFFIPVVSAVRAEVTAGLQLSRAGEAVSTGERVLVGLGRGTYLSAKYTLLAPYTMITHPIEAAKAMLRPWEVFTSLKRVPLATSQRGSYSATMDMEKVLAGEGEEALATRAAMAKVQKLMQSGQASGSVPIIVDGVEISTLKFSGTGLQGILRQISPEGKPIEVTLTSTPYGPEFTGVGVKVGEGAAEPVLFTSTETPLGFAFQSATGKMPLYVYKGNKLLGTIVVDDAGRLVVEDMSGYRIGEVAEGAKIQDIKGNKFGIWRDGQIYKDWKAVEPIKAAPVKTGLIMTEDPALIGKYYAGQKEYDQATKTLLTINKDGMLIDDAGKVIREAKPKAVALFPEGTEISSLKTGQVIGKIKAQPTFVMVYNKGVQELPQWAAEAKTMDEMERRAWQLFKSDKYSGDLYEGFKQYAIFMENEGAIPKGTAIIPVLDDEGKAVMLWTRAPSGKKIQVPMMQLASKDWFERSLGLTRELSGKPTTFKPFTTASEALKNVKNFPQESTEAFTSYMRANNKEVGWYGGIVEGLGTEDIDIFAVNPKKTAQEIYQILKNSAKSNRQVALLMDKDSGIIRMLKDGVDIKVVEIHPLSGLKGSVAPGLKPFETSIIDGVQVQTPQSQLTKLFQRMTKEFGGKGYARWSRLARAMEGDVDLGIGAKPPTLKQLVDLKARGIWNTVRDIFVQGLSKEVRLANAEKVAPDLEADTRALLQLEDRVAEAERAYRTTLTAAGRDAAAIVEAKKAFDRIDARYHEQRIDLQDRMLTRALVLDRISRELPREISEESYRNLIEYLAFREQARVPRREEIAVREERVERAERTERIPRTERTERVERTERTERPLRAERAERGERAERTERIPRTERVERAPRVERPPRPPRIPRPIERLRLLRLSKSPILSKEETKAKQEAKRREFAGAITWRQGALGKPPKGVWYAVKAPYSDIEDVGVFIGEPPPDAQIVKGGAKSAFRSIQTITGNPPKKLKIDLGFQDVLIRAPKKRPGERGAIWFERDIGQRTMGDITIGRGRPRVTKETVKESVAVNPIGSSRMPKEVAMAIGSYKAKITPEGKVKLKVRRL
jgi:hypothetical protein